MTDVFLIEGSSGIRIMGQREYATWWYSGGSGILSSQQRFWEEIRMELRNFIFSTQDLISGSPNQGCDICVIVIKTFHDAKSFQNRSKHNLDCPYSIQYTAYSIQYTVRINCE